MAELAADMQVIIFEVNLNGHHPTYLEKIVYAHLELGPVVTVVFSDKFVAHAVIVRLCQSYGDPLRVVTLSDAECTYAMKSRWGDVVRELCLWRIFLEILSLCVADRHHSKGRAQERGFDQVQLYEESLWERFNGDLQETYGALIMACFCQNKLLITRII